MDMIGTIINVAAVLVGSAVGLLLRRGMKKQVVNTIMQGLGLCTILIGVMGAIQTQNMLLVILSMVVGGVAGSWVDIERRMNQLGAYAERRLASSSEPGEGGNEFAKGFVASSLLFCVGAMAVVGALNSGIRGDHSTLIAKSMLDGVASVVFAGSMGAGVMLSALVVLVYQGAIALLGSAIAPLLENAVVREMSAVGGLLIVGIGLNMLLERDIKVANLLPAIFVPFLYFSIAALFG